MQAVILNVRPIDFPGGGERYAVRLGDFLSRRGFSVDFVTLRHPPRQTDLLVLNGAYGTLLWSAFKWISRAKHVWVVPHESLYHAAVLSYGPLHREAALSLSYLLPIFYHFWSRRKNLHLLAVSPQNAEHLRELFRVEPFCVPNGVSVQPQLTEKVRTIISKVETPFWGMVVSRWDWAKNPRILLRLFRFMPENISLLVRSTPDGVFALSTKYRFISWPPFKRKNLFWLESLTDQQELWGLMSQANFVLFPSAYEGFGYVALEAAALGVPVFLTPVGVGAEFAKDPVLQSLLLKVPPYGTQTPNEVWTQIENLLSNSHQLDRVRNRLRIFASRYTLQAWEERLDLLLLRTFGEDISQAT